MKLSKVYDPVPVEERWYRYWIERGLFVADIDSDKRPFSMVIPPPNVTGSLHMGHALNNTLQDVLVRYKKMTGFNVLWLPGTDHAGIATQNVVERILRDEGIDRDSIRRDELIERIWRWKEESGRTIVNQLKRLGAGCDWTRERFTMDPGLSRAVREVFVRLFEEGLIYKDNYIINWCPRCETALSDLEVEYRDTHGKLYYIDYPLKSSEGHLTIATTRPETMLGDTAVAVHPDDDRYREAIGKEVVLPLTNRIIPVIADDYVDISFGTGALKITPAHDPNDFLIGKKYRMPQLQVIGPDGKMTEDAGTPFIGMDRFECRERVIRALKDIGVLSRVEDYMHRVGHCYRCDTVIEPLVMPQWFVSMKPLAKPAIDAVRSGQIRFIPKGWENTYFSWMENIKDWCISRQIYWGHRIPVWYCGRCSGKKIDIVFFDRLKPSTASDKQPVSGGTYAFLRGYGFSHAEIVENMERTIISNLSSDEMIVSRVEPSSCPACGSDELIQDSDVLDTWFSSALWPFSTMGWPDETEELERFYPTSVLVTSFDIIFFWVARMIMMGLKFMGEIPFRDVYIHALVRDIHGEKMSKSRGNVIDPLVMMERYGTDSLRFTLVSLAAQGRDIKLSEERMEGYRNFVNKLWNAARYVFMNVEDYDEGTRGQSPSLMDRWILSRLQQVVEEVRVSIEEYRFNEAASSIYQFVWHEFCDWYIEATKPVLSGGMGEEPRRSAQYTILKVLRDILRLLHPFMPFVTEEIWRGMGEEESILLAGYPEYDEALIDECAIRDAGFIMDMVRGIRNIRSELNIPPSLRLKASYVGNKSPYIRLLEDQGLLVSHLARLSSLSRVDDRPVSSLPIVLNEIEAFVLLEGTIDIEEEEKRLKKGIDKVSKELSMIEKKLANQAFLNNAPEDVVEKERKKGIELSAKLDKLKEQLERIRALR